MEKFIDFMKKILVLVIFSLVMIPLASAELFIVSVDKWADCKKESGNITICEKSHVYTLIEQYIIPNIDVHYYDTIIDDFAKLKNERINNLENKVTGYASYSSEITDWYSTMEKVYLAGIVLLSLLLVNAYYQIYKIKNKK